MLSKKSAFFTWLKKNCFKILCILMLMGVAFMGLCFMYVSKIRDISLTEKKQISVTYGVTEREVKDGDSIVQTFHCLDKIEYFDIQFQQIKELNHDFKIDVLLIDNKKNSLIQKWTLNPSQIKEGMNRFYLDEDKEKISDEYVIQINFRGEGSAGIYVSEINQYNGGKLEVNGKKEVGDLSFSVYAGTNSFLTVFFIIITLLLLFGGIVSYVLIFRKKVCFEKTFVFVFLILGIGHMLLMPAYSTPDERAHFSTAYYYSNIIMDKDALDKNGNVLVRSEDLRLNVENIRPSLSTYALISDNLFKGCQNDTLVSYDRPPLSVPFWSYAPQTLGITFARLLGMGNIMLLFMGDIFALVFYAVCIYFALKLVPFGKGLMAAITLLPMTLETAGSFSYDVVVNGLSFLFIGFVFYLAYKKKEIRIHDWVILAVLMFLLAPVKVVYALLAFLCFLIPVRNKKKFWIGAAGVIASGGLSCAILRLSAIMNLAVQSGSGSAGIVENTYTIPYILSDIPRVIGVIYNTLCRQTDAIFAPLYGQKLGYWDVSVPYYISFAFVIVLVVALFIKENEDIYIKSWQKLLMLILIIGMIGGIILSMMLDFTDISDTVVRGIQGRYFIPFLPLVGFLFRGKEIITKKNLDSQILISMYVLNYFSLFCIFETIITR